MIWCDGSEFEVEQTEAEECCTRSKNQPFQFSVFCFLLLFEDLKIEEIAQSNRIAAAHLLCVY